MLYSRTPNILFATLLKRGDRRRKRRSKNGEKQAAVPHRSTSTTSIDCERIIAVLRTARTADEIPAAEQRLRELGFQVEVQGNVVAYKLMHENRLVLADPRIVGRLEFHVFSDEKPTKKTKTESFYLLDSWKADIPAKFRARLIKACSTFPPRKDS